MDKSSVEAENNVQGAKCFYRTLSRFIRDDLHMKAYRRSVGQDLDARLKKIRHERAKRLLQWLAANGHENILFAGEKFNKQCDKMYAHSSAEAKERTPLVQWGHHPESMMIWWGVSYQG